MAHGDIITFMCMKWSIGAVNTWSSAGASVSPHARVLHVTGILRTSWSGSGPRVGVGVGAHAVYRALVLVVTSLYLVQEFVYAYQVRGDMDKLSKVMFLLLCHITSLAKQVVFHIDAGRIDRLIGDLNDTQFNESEPPGPGLLARTRDRARHLLATYTGCAVVTCTMWLAFSLLSRAKTHTYEFAFWTGFETDSTFIFPLVLLYSYYVTTLVGIANTTMDAFIATLLYQCQTQFTILRLKVERLPESAREMSAASGENYQSIIMKLFIRCLSHYEKITDTATLLQDIFGTAILVQFTIGGWILCMAAYKIVSLKVFSLEFASMTLFIFCILTELFLYCYFGNELTLQSEKLVGSVYMMAWVDTPLQFRRSLLLLMERARRPLRPAAGRVLPLSLETFLKILKSSYTFYTVLRQTK